ncbi:MAG: hypothetical protein CMB80_08900 [Flammeovirgaceae bacterium]|nr:hypothetical protein [Flammeovirgaceae bacterium]
MGNKIKIGVIGQGFVGSAIREGLKGFYEIYTYDLNPELRNCETLVDVVKNAEVIFVCLPTPMTNDGSCHIGIVKGVISDIDEICKTNNYKNRIAIIKSTVPPGTTDKLNATAKNIAVAFSPEFLTEANSFEDFKNQTRIIIGANRPASTRIKSMFRKAFPMTPIVKTSASHAETVKYFINCFLSTKVSFANEMYQYCDAIGVDYDKVVEYALYDKRLGTSHFSVPGPDGDFGFGGHCFPKDLAAMIHEFQNVDVNPSVLKAAQQKNNEIRNNKDWEKMLGRAII